MTISTIAMHFAHQVVAQDYQKVDYARLGQVYAPSYEVLQRWRKAPVQDMQGQKGQKGLSGQGIRQAFFPDYVKKTFAYPVVARGLMTVKKPSPAALLNDAVRRGDMQAVKDMVAAGMVSGKDIKDSELLADVKHTLLLKKLIKKVTEREVLSYADKSKEDTRQEHRRFDKEIKQIESERLKAVYMRDELGKQLRHVIESDRKARKNFEPLTCPN
jgi:hypothetical protein